MSSDSTPSSLSSEESDEESATEGNNSELHITISDENQLDVKPKLKGAIKLKAKVDSDKDDEDPKAKIQHKELTPVEYHPLTNKKFEPIENDPFFSG